MYAFVPALIGEKRGNVTMGKSEPSSSITKTEHLPVSAAISESLEILKFIWLDITVSRHSVLKNNAISVFVHVSELTHCSTARSTTTRSSSKF